MTRRGERGDRMKDIRALYGLECRRRRHDVQDLVGQSVPEATRDGCRRA